MTNPFDTLPPDQLATAAGGFKPLARIATLFRNWRAAADARLLDDEFGIGHFRRFEPRR